MVLTVIAVNADCHQIALCITIEIINIWPKFHEKPKVVTQLCVQIYL